MSRKGLKRGTAQWAIEEIKRGECIIASSFSFRTKFMKGESNEGIIVVDGNDDSIVGHLSFDEFLEEYSSQVRSFEPYKNPPNAMVGDWVRSRESNRYYQIHDVFMRNKEYLYEIRAAGAPGRTQVIGEEDFGTFYLSSIYPDLSAISEGDEYYSTFNDSKEVTAKALIMKNWPNRCHERCPHAHNDHINRDYSCLLFDDDMDDPGIRCQSCIDVFGAGEENEQ